MCICSPSPHIAALFSTLQPYYYSRKHQKAHEHNNQAISCMRLSFLEYFFYIFLFSVLNNSISNVQNFQFFFFSNIFPAAKHNILRLKKKKAQPQNHLSTKNFKLKKLSNCNKTNHSLPHHIKQNPDINSTYT